MISVKDVDLIFETNDGPVQALRNVSLRLKKVTLFHLLDLLDVEKLLCFVL